MTHSTTSPARHAAVWAAFLIEHGFGFEVYYQEGDRDTVIIDVIGTFAAQDLSKQDKTTLDYHYHRTTVELYGERE